MTEANPGGEPLSPDERDGIVREVGEFALLDVALERQIRELTPGRFRRIGMAIFAPSDLEDRKTWVSLYRRAQEGIETHRIAALDAMEGSPDDYNRVGPERSMVRTMTQGLIVEGEIPQVDL